MSDEFVLQSSWFGRHSGLREAVEGGEHSLRLALWLLLEDERLWQSAWRGLCLIGDTEDLERLARDRRAEDPKVLPLLAGSFLRPTTERQWDLLRKAALRAVWHEQQAIWALRLTESDRADAILAEALALNVPMEIEIRRAMEYRRAWRRPTSGASLEGLVADFGSLFRPELSQYVRGVFLSEDGQRALGSFLLGSEDARFEIEVTYGYEFGAWGMRGVHYAVHSFAPPWRVQRDRISRPMIDFGEPPKIVP